MTVFPNGKHDDQVDSTAQFLDWFKKPFPGQGIFDYYREMAEKLKPPKPVYVRLEQAAAGYNAALEVFVAAEADYFIGMCRENLNWV
jgi:hypothetical protein